MDGVHKGGIMYICKECAEKFGVKELVEGKHDCKCEICKKENVTCYLVQEGELIPDEIKKILDSKKKRRVRSPHDESPHKMSRAFDTSTFPPAGLTNLFQSIPKMMENEGRRTLINEINLLKDIIDKNTFDFSEKDLDLVKNYARIKVFELATMDK